MVRVVLPTGEMKEFMQLECFKEKTVSFRERTKRVVIKAEQMDSEVTGIRTGQMLGHTCWGNLSSEKVREILSEMAEKGSYNFLDKGYEIIKDAKEIPKLNGRPYFLEETPRPFGSMGMGCGMGCGMMNDCFENEDDCFLDEDDE